MTAERWRGHKPGLDGLVQAGLVLMLGVRLALSLHNLGAPGLQYDETNFVNAATLRIPGLFIFHEVDGIPLMVFAYTGALKAWIYAPIFSVFGESATSIRLPVELLVTLGIALLYPAVRDLVNRSVALMAFAALCFENSIFWLTRDDVGPSALEFFFKCLGLFAVARFSRSGGRGRWLALLWLSLALGVFNKLNYIWVVNAVTVATAVVLLVERRLLRERWRALALWLTGLGLIYGAFGWYYLADHISTLFGGGSGLTQPWIGYQIGIERILTGTWFYGYAIGPISIRVGLVWIMLILFAIGAVTSVLPGRRNLPIAALALSTLLIGVQILFTKQATAGWHYIAILPFALIVVAYGAWAPLSLIPMPTLRAVGLVVVTGAFVAYSGELMDHYFRSLHREPAFSGWSPAIYRLSALLERTPGTVITSDWGIQTPLFALRPSRRFDEYAFEFETADPTALHAVAAQIEAIPGPKLVVSHVADEQVFPDNNAHLHTALGSHLHLVDVVAGNAGVPVYDVYSIG